MDQCDYQQGERLEIRAGVHLMAGYSAHADQNGLVAWVNAMAHKPARIKLVHGDERARRALEDVFNKESLIPLCSIKLLDFTP